MEACLFKDNKELRGHKIFSQKQPGNYQTIYVRLHVWYRQIQIGTF